MKRVILLLLVGAFALHLPGLPAAAAPRAEAWPRWERHDPHATRTIDHGDWGRFLARYVSTGVDGVARVSYGAVAAEDRQLLKRYLAHLAGAPVSMLARDEQMAFWINLYNALTVDVVLDHYPVASIREIDISPGLLSNGPWGRKLVTVEGETVSLDDIEHRILRPLWRDPRVHYALNCAALGCPSLLAEPFTGRSLDHALDLAAKAYVRHPRGMRVTEDGLYVSSIYVWFQEDFGGEAGVIRHLMAYADPAAALQLQRLDGIASHGYDWRLNDSHPRQR